MELIPNEQGNIPQTTRLTRVVDFLTKTFHKTNIYLFGDITPVTTDDIDNYTYNDQPTENKTVFPPNQTTATDI